MTSDFKCKGRKESSGTKMSLKKEENLVSSNNSSTVEVVIYSYIFLIYPGPCIIHELFRNNFLSYLCKIFVLFFVLLRVGFSVDRIDRVRVDMLSYLYDCHETRTQSDT